MQIITADPEILVQLWRRAHAMFARAMAALGEPAALAVLTLSQALRREIAGLIATLESIVRKLVFAEAAQLKRDEVRTAGLQARPLSSNKETGAPEGARSKALRTLDLSRPETWPAHFSFAIPRDPLAVRESRAARIRSMWVDAPVRPPPCHSGAPSDASGIALPPRRIPTVHRLALRLEAVRRVLANPAPHARRLACLFRRLNRRFPEAAQRFAIASVRPYVVERGDARLIVEAMAAAMWGVPVLADTS